MSDIDIKIYSCDNEELELLDSNKETKRLGSNVDIKICGVNNCSELELLGSNTKDNTKENLLEVVGATDLLEVETGVPSENKTKLKVFRDSTKLDTADFLEQLGKVNDKLDTKMENSKLNDLATKEELKKLATKEEMNLLLSDEVFSNYATLEDLETKADKTVLNGYATREELNLKANKSEIDSLVSTDVLNERLQEIDIPDVSTLATKEELELKANKDYVTNTTQYFENKIERTKEEVLESFPDVSNFVTNEELSKKANISDLPNFNTFATKEELNKKANKGDVSNFVTQNDYNNLSDTVEGNIERVDRLNEKVTTNNT